MRLSSPRITPLEETDLDQDQLAVFAPNKKSMGVLNIFRTLINHVGLMKRWTVFANHVLYKSTLSPRDREILILRTGWLCQSEYEWAQHVRIGLNSGLSEEEIERIKTGAEADGWSELERNLLKATDELHGDSFISDSTWNALNEYYNTQQLMDLVFAVGQYHLVSMALNTFGVQLEDGVKGF